MGSKSQAVEPGAIVRNDRWEFELAFIPIGQSWLLFVRPSSTFQFQPKLAMYLRGRILEC